MDILKLVKELEPRLIEDRRDLHRHPEVGWTEFRTSAKVAEVLMDLGYEVRLGEEIINPQAVMGAPKQEKIISARERALAHGANPDILQKIGDFPGVMGILETQRPGPVIAFRFDMDALKVTEAQDHGHKPHREGFSSMYHGHMHACGHDGHTAIGMNLARLLIKIKEHISGTVKLIFQPAEEGVRGARAMVEAGIVDDVDYFFAFHLGFGVNQGLGVVTRVTGFLATSKLDVTLKGRSAHAGAFPQEGKNALLGAATAALNLHAIPPHSDGVTRVNVGVLTAGAGRNIVPQEAFMQIETRGQTSDLDDYVKARAIGIIEASAKMYDLGCSIAEAGGAKSAEGDGELADIIKRVGLDLGLDHIEDTSFFGASDDATTFMERVQSQGGKALYYQVLTPIAADHHNNRFDFDERALGVALNICGEVILRLS